MGYRQDCEEQYERKRGHEESLRVSQGRWRQKQSQPSLQRAHTEKRRLEARTTVRGLRDFEEQLSVCVRVAEGSDNAIVAIHLDREAQSPQLPPEGEIPWHKNQRE